MHIAHLLLLIAATQAVKFLAEPAVFIQEEEQPFMYQTIFAQQSSLFTEEELAKNTEMAKQPSSDFNYLDEQTSSLDSAQDTQVFLAAQYEKDLPAQGDCVILYTACDFKGTSGKICKSEEALSFQLPVYSIYVPLGQQFTTLDSNSKEQMAYLTSEKCLSEPIILADTQQDVFIAKASQSLSGDDLSDEEMVGPQPQLAQETQEQFNTDEIEAQPVEQAEVQPVEEQKVDETIAQQSVDIVSTEQTISNPEQTSVEEVPQLAAPLAGQSQ